MSVRVTKHAAERLRERFADFRTTPLGEASQAIRRDVREAQAAGRRSVSEPSWMNPHGTLRPGSRRSLKTKRLKARTARRHGTLRYFWTDAEREQRRVYKAARVVEQGGEVWVVVTVMAPR